jgi:hypothetical protein
MVMIFSDSYVLSAQPDFNRTNPVLGWDNQITAAGTVADFEELNFPATEMANPSTNLFWRSTSLDEQYITFDLDDERTNNYIGIARHNFGSGGVVVSVEVQLFDESDWTQLIDGFVVADDNPIFIRFLDVAALRMRIKLTPLATIPEVAVVFIGTLLVIPMEIPAGHTPLIDGIVTNTTDGLSESGDYLGSIVLGQKLASTVSFQYLNSAWYRASMRPFIKNGRGTPFFFSGFPDSFPREAGYAWLTNDPRPDFIDNEWVNITLAMGGIIS